MEVEGSMNPVIFGSSHDQSGRRFRKKVPLVWGLAVRLLVVPGVLRALLGLTVLFPVLLRLPPV